MYLDIVIVRCKILVNGFSVHRAAQLFSNKATSGLGWKEGGARGTEGKELNVSTPQGNTQGFSLGKWQ
jgi:hypothetical protein